MSNSKLARRFVIAVPNIWLILFFMIPFLVVLKISLAEPRIAIPPYSPLWERVNGDIKFNINFEN